MSTQPELFKQGGSHPGTPTSRGWHPRRQDATDTRDEAYRSIQNSINRKQKEYLTLMRNITNEGQQTKRGHVIHDLTDAEAAALLGWRRTSVNGRRNELCGGSNHVPGTDLHPLIIKSRRRDCFVTGNTAWAWQANTDLFSQEAA